MKLAFILLALTSAFAQENFNRDTVIFIGSSTMGHWKPRMEKDFGPIPTWNFGENGTDFHYLHETVTDWAKKYPAKRWVIYSGDNDLHSDPPRTPTQVAEDMAKTVDLIRAQDADSQVYVISIKCRVYPEAETTCAKVKEANKLMAEQAGKLRDVFFVDTMSAMSATGRKMSDFFQEDQTHLSEAGYDVWRDTLLPFLRKPFVSSLKASEEATPEPAAASAN